MSNEMKITRNRLTEIIKEELDKVLNEDVIRNDHDIDNFLSSYEGDIIDYYERNNLDKNGFNGAVEAVNWALDKYDYEAADMDIFDAIVDDVNWSSSYMY